jgi:hypothetical protein|tara:strand:+ start:939 stop:1265 length:327 start_codon:yes stop_codon:yes gene_type:complete
LFSFLQKLENRLKTFEENQKVDRACRKPIPKPYFYWEKEMQTVGEAALARYPDMTYDHALPQGWVDQCCEKGLDPRGHFVWLYDNFAGRPAPITKQGDRMVSLLALDP